MARLSQLLAYLVAGFAAYWVWTGPLHDMRTVSFDEQMEQNTQNMKRCLRAQEFVAGSSGSSVSDPETRCAQQHGLYQHEGRWYSYSQERPANS